MNKCVGNELEVWEYNVITSAHDYINTCGADAFKKALRDFNEETFFKLFHPEHKSKRCCLTNPK